MLFSDSLQDDCEHHPVFGRISCDHIDRKISEIMANDPDDDLRETSQREWFEAALATIGTNAEIPAHPSELQPRQFQPAPPAQPEAFTPATRTDELGTWDLLVPGTCPQSGDEVEDHGVWRLRASTKPRSTSPADQYDFAVHAAAQARQAVEALEARGLTDSAPALLQALEDLERCNHDRLQKLRALETWERTEAASGRAQDWARIDAHRQTPAGRIERNADRRTTDRGPNADLSSMTPEERKAHRNQQKNASKQAERARKKALAEAAATGNLGASIGV